MGDWDCPGQDQELDLLIPGFQLRRFLILCGSRELELLTGPILAKLWQGIYGMCRHWKAIAVSGKRKGHGEELEVLLGGLGASDKP